MGLVDQARAKRVWHAFNAPPEGRADLQEDGQPARDAVAPWDTRQWTAPCAVARSSGQTRWRSRSALKSELTGWSCAIGPERTHMVRAAKVRTGARAGRPSESRPVGTRAAGDHGFLTRRSGETARLRPGGFTGSVFRRAKELVATHVSRDATQMSAGGRTGDARRRRTYLRRYLNSAAIASTASTISSRPNSQP